VDAVTISLDIPNPVEPQDIIHIEVARSRRWATEQGIAEGATVPIDLPEIGIHGTASVIAVRPAPREQSGTGCLVTSRITHVADQLLSVRLSSGSELSLTPAHRLFIEGRGWTPAGEMKAGESLRADRGEVRVLGILPGARNKPVYNLEVAMAHSYRVGTDEVWAHNQCPILERLGSDEALHQSYVRLAERVRFLEEDGSIVNAQFTRALKSLEKGKIDVDSLMNTLIRQAHYYYKNGNLRVVEFQDLERIILAFPELP